MTTLSVTHPDLSNGGISNADWVDQNFASVTSYVNTNVIVKDGSLQMTQPLPLFGGDPTLDTHAANKSWTDNWAPRNEKCTVIQNSTGGSSASTSYVDWPMDQDLIVQYTKRYDTSLIYVEYRGSNYITAGAGGVQFSFANELFIGGITKQFFNVAGVHHGTMGGAFLWTTFPAGTYNMKLAMKVISGGITLQSDINDWHALRVVEVAPN